MPPAVDDTRQRLIDAAGEIFAEVGFHGATVREICAQAKTNLAAINYHFGDKTRLYIETVRYARFENTGFEDFPSDLEPQEQLREFIRRLLTNLFDDSRPAWCSRIMVREFTFPSEANKRIVAEFVRPRSQMLARILEQLLPASIDAQQRLLIGLSISGQCIFHLMQRPIIEQVAGSKQKRRLTLDRLAEHIYFFSIAAINAYCLAPSAPSIHLPAIDPLLASTALESDAP